MVEKAKMLGATIGGAKPIANFRSALSKDDRFYSFKRNGEYRWWLNDVPLPEGWDETADDLLDRTAASSDSKQEGGDSHEATMS